MRNSRFGETICRSKTIELSFLSVPYFVKMFALLLIFIYHLSRQCFYYLFSPKECTYESSHYVGRIRHTTPPPDL